MSSDASQHGKSPVATNIRAARLAKGWTQRNLADEIDVDVMQVSRWERGATRPGGASEAELVRVLFGGNYGAMYADPQVAA